MRKIDINCDMGELWELHRNSTQARLMRYVSSVNIACGAHAGDERLMAVTVADARAAGVSVGAHPGYPDRENFGRKRLQITRDALRQSIVEQLRRLLAITEFVHIKPHGALYNVAARDAEIAATIAEAAGEVAPGAALVGLAGSIMLTEFAVRGFRVMAEAFADRRYEPDGTLRNRSLPGAVLTDPEEAAAQVLHIACEQIVIALDGTRVPVGADTICLHSDTPVAVENAAKIHAALLRQGFAVGKIVG